MLCFFITLSAVSAAEDVENQTLAGDDQSDVLQAEDYQPNTQQSNNDSEGVYVAGINATIYSSTFSRHNATNKGGAVYISGENTNVVNSNFSDVHAVSQAGAIYLGPHTYVS